MRLEGRPVAIIIPTKDNIAQLKNAVNSILYHTSYTYRLIIIESESTDGTAEYTDELARRYSFIKVYHTKAEGSIKAVNFGILKTQDEDIYLTQDDVIIDSKGYNWLRIMNLEAQKLEVGIVTTLGGIGVSGNTYYEGLRWVGTWSMYIPRTTINLIGIFDPNFKIGEDIDYAYRVKLAGLKISILPLHFEHHQKRATPHQDQSESIKREASIYFKQKHNLK